jgi:scyllo-inositol 2-dehydrogenase (NADP+)
LAEAPVRVGLLGYGMAGEIFHAPFIRHVARLKLTAVATSRSERAAALGDEVRVTSPDALVTDPEIDLVVIASPNETHFPLARAALEAGKHVVVDKPFMLSLEEADAVLALAARERRVLSVFHNRRWDGDFRTVRGIAGSGALGAIRLYEARWDRFRAAPAKGWREQPGPGAGLLADLGPHLVDQAIELFGAPEAVSADVARQREGARVDDYFEIRLHYGAMRATLGASSLVAAPRPRFALHGGGGSFVKHGLDPQAEQILAGLRPGSEGFGVEGAQWHGTLTRPDGGSERVPTANGDYGAYYERVADAILAGAPPPVDPADARLGLAILELARRSAGEGRRLALRL